MSPKKIFQFRRYIVTQAFIQWLFLNAVLILTGGKFWDSFFSNVLNILLVLFIWHLIYTYHHNNLTFDVLVDNRYEVESTYIYYQCVIMGSIWLIAVMLLSYRFNERPVVLMVYSLFFVAPLFWLKIWYHLAIYVWSHLFRTYNTYSTIDKMIKDDKKGNLTGLGGFLRLEFMFAVDECFDADFDLGITDEDLESVGSTLCKRVNTNGHTKEFIDELTEKNKRYENLANIGRVIIPGFFLLLGLYNAFLGGVSSSDFKRYESNVNAVNITQEKNNIEWKDINGDGILFYDDKSLAWDKENGVLFSLCQHKVKKENKDYYFWLYLYYPKEEAFIVYCTKEGAVSKDNPSNYYESFGEKNTIFNVYGNYFRERLKIKKQHNPSKMFSDSQKNKSKLTIDLREYHKLKLANKPIPNALKPQGNTNLNSKGQDDSELTDKIIPLEGTGATRKLERGTEAIVKRGVEIVVYNGPSRTRTAELYLPKDYDLEKTVVLILAATDYHEYRIEGLHPPKGQNVYGGWIEGKYLIPIKKRIRKKSEDNTTNGIIE